MVRHQQPPPETFYRFKTKSRINRLMQIENEKIPETGKTKETVAMKEEEDTVFEEELRETLDAFLLAGASS